MMFSSAISIAGSSIGMGLAFLAWIIKLILVKFKGEKISFVKVPFNKAILILFSGILVSFIGTLDFDMSLAGLEDILIVIILFYLVVNNVKTVKTIKKMFALGIVSIIISSIYATFYQHFYLGISRVDSTFMALDFGALLLIYCIFIMIFLFFNENGLKSDFLSGFALILLLVTLALNKSRGSWLGFVGGSVITFWLHKKKLIPIFLIVLLVVMLFAPAAIHDRIMSITDLKNNKSNYTRLGLWKSSLMIFRDNPINGVGINNFRQAYKSGYEQSNVDHPFSHAHSTFLNFLAETGAIGLGSLLYLFYSVLRFLYSGYKYVEDKFSKLFILGTFSSFIGTFLIQGMTESNFSKSVVGRTIWFLVALAVVLVKLSEKQEEIPQ
ncbi:O-antigen ligase [Halanaerobium salsuginis]|uniref:O-antigen ligase n=2 Tax=Halanaerobium salsuginis TaxID=29563 RepID=A0A1I4GV38_9FIRM|nr:O-antigen ligase [Halanaerobium salsuginis]